MVCDMSNRNESGEYTSTTTDAAILAYLADADRPFQLRREAEPPSSTSAGSATFCRTEARVGRGGADMPLSQPHDSDNPTPEV
jgi:hypothetical protein